jgi:hypothetical protein
MLSATVAFCREIKEKRSSRKRRALDSSFSPARQACGPPWQADSESGATSAPAGNRLQRAVITRINQLVYRGLFELRCGMPGKDIKA